MTERTKAASLLGKVGGKARWADKTPDERKAHAMMMVKARKKAARKAARARWSRAKRP